MPSSRPNSLKDVLTQHAAEPTVQQVRQLLVDNTLVVVDPRPQDRGPSLDVWFGQYQLDRDSVLLPNPALFDGGLSAVTLDEYTQVELHWNGTSFKLVVQGGEIAGHPVSWAVENNAQHL